ncbi:basic region leucin zipper protein [Moniliophthora roreri MCA 2997]|uniref:Basic region leucin zipper protein n=2 Tax=Moniliophthora roreri TaxID=221103 RepID=V2Y820_MONRO|nr:basic region leucin zipper protein [Moniliophthora roreri MCA 2997]KAI3603603.1 basic region leucin zipper protein [Moniliophthora roreri]
MTRGRKKDLTIPPSRALTQQRDYRARKAQYLAELESRCQRLQEENDTLREELSSLRAGLPFASPPDPQLMAASSELMGRLASTSEALIRFQKLAYPDAPPREHSSPPIASTSSTPSLRPAFFPSPDPSDGSSLRSPDLQSSRASSERSWKEDGYKPPESLRKILCPPDTPDTLPYPPLPAHPKQELRSPSGTEYDSDTISVDES